MKKTERLAKQYGCTESHVERAILVLVMHRLENIQDSSKGVNLNISEADIHSELIRKGLRTQESVRVTGLRLI